MRPVGETVCGAGIVSRDIPFQAPRCAEARAEMSFVKIMRAHAGATPSSTVARAVHERNRR